MKYFIGVYDYTVILTYMSLLSAIYGILQATAHNFTCSVFCLFLCGFFDAFDGAVARTKKNRTEDEKNFGIQLDSLCDVIAFGVLPAMIFYYMGVNGIAGILLIFFYCNCALIRLAFFNVLEIKRQKEEVGITKYYRGLPVTSSAIIVPIVYGIMLFTPEKVDLFLLHIMPAIIGFLFVYDFKVKKINIAKIFHIG